MVLTIISVSGGREYQDGLDGHYVNHCLCFSESGKEKMESCLLSQWRSQDFKIKQANIWIPMCLPQNIQYLPHLDEICSRPTNLEQANQFRAGIVCLPQPDYVSGRGVISHLALLRSLPWPVALVHTILSGLGSPLAVPARKILGYWNTTSKLNISFTLNSEGLMPRCSLR